MMASVKDRIRAAEAAHGADKTQDAGPSSRRGQKLSLKTDEHIKEEFLRRVDGGWHKRVDIGQEKKSTTPSSNPPIIKLTAETPVMPKSSQKLPGKMAKSRGASFESVAEDLETDLKIDDEGKKEWSRVEEMEAAQQAEMDAAAAKDGVPGEWDRVARMEAEQQAAMDAEAAAQRKKETSTTRSVPVNRSGDLSSKRENVKPPTRKASNIRQARVEDDDSGNELSKSGAENDSRPREQVLFDPEEWAEKKQARRERKASRQQARAERLSVHEDINAKSRARSPSIRLIRINHDDDESEAPARPKHRSRSRSFNKQGDDSYPSPPGSARRSTSSLWPSFGGSERRSISDLFDPSHSPRPRSKHGRQHSDDVSTASAYSEVSVKKLEFAEYIAGKRLDHLPLIPPKSPPRPMGFVRSLSHTGVYSEGYTRERKLLRKPSDDEVIEAFDHDWEQPKRHSRHASDDRRKDEPWQIRIVQGIARG